MDQPSLAGARRGLGLGLGLGAVTICTTCGRENPADARFCNSCAALLADSGLPREERKVVSVLFADLVEFTARAERLDPEDVRALQVRCVRQIV
jgi:class 3 adenylate cyclase